MASKCTRRGLGWTLGRISSQERVIKYWNELPRELMESLSLKVKFFQFKERLDMALNAVVSLTWW